MSKILAIETGFGKFSIALSENDQQISYHQSAEDNKQAEQLVPQVEQMLAAKQITYSQLDAIACNIGPASFTGLRIGITFARTIASSLNIKQIAVTSLESINLKQGAKQVFLRAGRGQVYSQQFDTKGQPTSQPCMLDEVLAKGSITQNVNAKEILAVAQIKFKLQKFTNNLSPMYVRPPDAKVSTKKL